MSVPEAVYVEWVDSTSAHPWTAPDDAPEPLVCKSIGWLVVERDDHIVVSASWDSQDPGHFDAPISIPRVAIIGLWRLSLR